MDQLVEEELGRLEALELQLLLIKKRLQTHYKAVQAVLAEHEA